MFAVHPGLQARSRLSTLTLDESAVRTMDLFIWMVMGMFAACVASMPDWHLRLPGHAILRSILPMTLGLSLAPRRMGGAVMGASALLTGLCLRGAGFADIGFGALTSLTLTGPLLDAVLWKVQSGRRLYLGIVLAGLSANLLAFAAKASEKLLLQSVVRVPGSGGGMGMGTGGGLGRGGGTSAGLGAGKRAFGDWLTDAAWSYPLCGILAGLICATLWFRWRDQPANDPQTESPASIGASTL